MQSGYGIFGGEAKNWAKLKFTPERARWVQAEEWHPEQKTTLHKDGSYTLEIPYADERELLGDILLFGPDVEVIGPQSLKRNLISSLEKSMAIYRK
jgi:predicted DNA-binding transcriptional regulator YafY